MKTVLRAAGIPCARHALVHDAGRRWRFADEVGFPLVAKPPAGAGAQATFRLDDAARSQGWLGAVPPSAEAPGAARGVPRRRGAHLRQRDDGRQTVWSSIADYRPPPLEVLRNPWIQWTVLLPRDITGPEYDGIHRSGPPRCGRSA